MLQSKNPHQCTAASKIKQRNVSSFPPKPSKPLSIKADRAESNIKLQGQVNIWVIFNKRRSLIRWMRVFHSNKETEKRVKVPTQSTISTREGEARGLPHIMLKKKKKFEKPVKLRG
jgi:hypothetical protein